MRVGIVACSKYWHKGCPGINHHVLCFDALQQGHGPLGHIPNAHVVAYRPCNQCSKKNLLEVAESMVRQDNAAAIVFASCLFLGDKCPQVAAVCADLATTNGLSVIQGSYLEPEEDLSALPETYQVNIYSSYLVFLNHRYLEYQYQRQSCPLVLP